MLSLVFVLIFSVLVFVNCLKKEEEKKEDSSSKQSKVPNASNRTTTSHEKPPKSSVSLEQKTPKKPTADEEALSKLGHLEKEHECEQLKKGKKCRCESYVNALEAMRKGSVSPEVDQEIRKRLEMTDGYWDTTKSGKQHRKLYMKEEVTQMSSKKKNKKSREKTENPKTKKQPKRSEKEKEGPSDAISMQVPPAGNTTIGDYEHLIPPDKEKELIATYETQESLSGAGD